VTAHLADRYECGPLDVTVTSNSEWLLREVADTLDLYNVPWPDERMHLHLEIRAGANEVPMGPGRYLECARMNVDHSGTATLVATCRSGAVASGDPRTGKWNVQVPGDADDPWILTDMESVLSLVLTEGWRAAGFVPVHAGTVVRNGKCTLICAESGGGKTTLTAALIRRGWQTLGDDKLLLRINTDGTPELSALVHTFNLDPRSRSWFPEVGDLERLPVYSEWTEKRKVHPESIWPGSTIVRAAPTHLLQIRRSDTARSVSISTLENSAVLSALLHQTVVPSDALTARRILSTVGATASQLEGFHVALGENTYSDPDCLAELESLLS
jgi:hypothetical protein